MSSTPSFHPVHSYLFPEKNLRANDLIAIPSEHFESSVAITIHIGAIQKVQRDEYMPYAMVASNGVMIEGQAQMAAWNYEHKLERISPHLTGVMLAEAIFRACFATQRERLMPLLRKLSDEELKSI